jgi:ribosomal protein S27AE
VSAAFVHADGEPVSPFDRLAATERPLSEVLGDLRTRGFDGDIVAERDAIPPGLCCRRCGRRFFADHVEVVEVHRFEGPTDPEDEALLLALRCPRCRGAGTLVTAYGPSVSADEAELLAALSTRATRSPRQPEKPPVLHN